MKIAHTTPPACAVCYQQHVNRTHVDFEVAYDGPVIPGAVPRPIDDLIVCEKCLADAAKLIGLTREDMLRAQVDELTAQRDTAVQLAAGHQAYSNQLEAALALRPEGAIEFTSASGAPASSEPRDHSSERGPIVSPAPVAPPAPSASPKPKTAPRRKRSG
jgi:hypothetical protein